MSENENPSSSENTAQAILLTNLEFNQHTAKTLEKALIKSNGVLRIVVHPFYMDYDLFEENSAYLPNQLAGDKTLQEHLRNRNAHLRLFESTSDAKPPTLILESEMSINQTKQVLGGAATKTFIHPTLNAAAIPYFKEMGDINTYFPSDHETDLAWEKLNQFLKEAGVQKVIISGMMLGVDEGKGWSEDLDQQLQAKNHPNTALKYCVGTAAGYLAKYFEVEVSNMTSPDKLKTKAQSNT